MVMDLLGESGTVATIGALGGIALGLAARLGRFCTLGALEDFYYGQNSDRLRMWGVAIGVAVMGTFALSALGLLDLRSTFYLSVGWNPLASVLGGLAFGYGMAIAGNCGYGALARLGGGDLRSFVIVLVMGLSAYMTLAGPLARLRIWAFAPSAPDGTPGLAALIGRALSVDSTVIGLGIGAALVLATLLTGRFWTRPALVFWGAVVGLAVVSGWAGTAWVARHGFAGLPVVSHTFSAPVGETMLFMMTASARNLSFGIGSVAGVLMGAFAGSLLKGHFRWEACEDPRELRRQIVGAALMGIGAVVAMGCSVGQGLSAFSVLAYGAPVTLAAIAVGAIIGLRHLVEGFTPL